MMDVFYIITIKDGETTATQSGYFRGGPGHARYQAIYDNVVEFCGLKMSSTVLYVIEDLPDGFPDDQHNYLAVDGRRDTP